MTIRLAGALLPLLLAAPAAAQGAHSLGDVKSVSCAGAQCDIVAAVDADGAQVVPLRLVFFGPAIVRWWLAIDGNFSDTGAAADVIVGTAQNVTVALRDAGAFYEVSQAPPPVPNVVVRLQKAPLLLSILVDGQVALEEAAPLSWNSSSSWQTLARDAAPFPAGLSAEYFYGGGMQNGRFSHRDQAITIGVDYNWDDGGHPNSAPWYLSTAGYGVLRNTWAPGGYSFTGPVVTAHNESNRLDAFVVLAAPGDVKALLGAYTRLTGPPFLPPLYGLFLGDSDCYHNGRHGNSTQVAIAVAQLYRDYDMPSGWMLPNDGYGCGYGEGPVDFPSNLTDLTLVVAQLHARGVYTGLWTSTGMPNIQNEVGVAGTRVCKTDVGWIGAGYKYAFDGVTLCADGIERYSSPPSRRFVWTVEGWAASHRLAVMWTGDNSGSMDYVRWQVPTFVGAGFSAQAHVSGDVDGIFGGSPESYVRDLQFKALTTTVMTMSGWAPNPDKQPWTWGEPYTAYNRAALKLKARLVPYVYSLCREAYETGVPPIRAALLEFPADGALYAAGNNATAYQFMTGPFLLAAPVYEAGAVTRDGIYLPAGAQWADWWNGTLYAGNQTLNGYDAPLAKLPLLVRAGAIVPLGPELAYFDAAPGADPMSLELWPAGNSSFTLYEDDGVTRDALPPTNAYAKTAIAVAAPPDYLSGTSSGNVTVTVGAAVGAFAGQLAARGWRLNVRCRNAPLLVVLQRGGEPELVPQMQSAAQLAASPLGWFHDPYLQPQAGGLLTVKLSGMAAAQGFAVTLSNGPSYPHIGTETCDTPQHHQVENQRFAFDNATGLITVLPAGDPPLCLTVGQDDDPDSHTRALEVQACAAELAGAQQFAVVPASGQLALLADATQCLDQDVSDDRVILYGCHDPSAPGNQAWAINPDGASQHIVSVENGLCMCVLPPAAGARAAPRRRYY